MHVESVVPPLAGWRTFPRAVTNLLAFGVAALVGEWLVHQLAYLIEFGSRFDAVMATTPHRYYMTQSGVVFAIAILALLSLVALVLRVDTIQRRRLLHLLPVRLHRFIPEVRVRMSVVVIGRTALVLALVQMAIYLVQENLETLAEGRGSSGLAALVAPEHWPVAPLHLLLALCGSLFLWTLASLVRRSHTSTKAMERLVRLFMRGAAPGAFVALGQHAPNRRLVSGIHTPRAPPLFA